MKILVNGAWRELTVAAQGPPSPAPTLETVLSELGLAGGTIATAVNGEFVAAGARACTPVHEGDRVEVLAPMQGG